MTFNKHCTSLYCTPETWYCKPPTSQLLKKYVGKSLSGYVSKFEFGGDKYGEGGESKLKGLKQESRQNTRRMPHRWGYVRSSGATGPAEVVSRPKARGVSPDSGRGRADSDDQKPEQKPDGNTSTAAVKPASSSAPESAGAAIPPPPRPGR